MSKDAAPAKRQHFIRHFLKPVGWQVCLRCYPVTQSHIPQLGPVSSPSPVMWSIPEVDAGDVASSPYNTFKQ